MLVGFTDIDELFIFVIKSEKRINVNIFKLAL